VVLERVMAQVDESVAEHVLVDADPARTYAAVGGTEISGDRVLGLLGGLTDLADRMGGVSLPAKTLGELLGPELGFVILADESESGRIVGIAVRYSPFERAVERLTAEQFAGFDEPGYLKSVAAFSVTAQDGGRTLLTCEVRVQATDDDTRSTLRTTWFVVGAGLRMLLRRLLELIRTEAERQSGAQGAEHGDGDRDHGDAGDLGTR